MKAAIQAITLNGQSIDMQRGRLKLICRMFLLQHTILVLIVMKLENWLPTRVQNVPRLLMTASQITAEVHLNRLNTTLLVTWKIVMS
jgi:hypothetical protein